MPVAMPSREEMLKRVRQKREEKSKGRKDPDELRVPRLKENDALLEYYFIVLPELQVGDTCKTGTNERANDLWYYENGFHFMENQKIECPRLHDGGSCPLCDMGFELMQDSDDKEYRSQISSKFLARSHYAVNVYLLNTQKNPEQLRGKVMWFNMPRTIFDKMDACLSSDDPGDSEDPKACGIFYHPWEGTYTFKLVARKKGEWNTYEGSCFLPRTYAPLAKLPELGADGKPQPDENRITEILSLRHVLQDKFPIRNEAKLQAIVEKIKAREQGQDEEVVNPADEAVEETPAPKATRPAPKPAPARPAAAAAKPAAKPVAQAAKPVAAKPAAKPAAAAPVAEEVAEEAPAEEVAEAPTQEETSAQLGEEATEPAAEAEAPAEEVAEETPPPPPVQKVAPKPAAKPVTAAKPSAPAAKPTAPAAKPATAAAPKPAPAAKTATPAPAPAEGDDGDAELTALLGAIKKKA